MRTTTVLTIACAASAVLSSSIAIADAGGPTLIQEDAKVLSQNKAGRAGVCQIGPGLGSTLLFPFFESDLVNQDGVVTLISVNNGLYRPTMVRLVVWSDWGIPVLAFDIYLKGFDVQTINVKSLLNGYVPVTGVGADLSGFESCHSLPPHYPSPALTPGQIQHLETALTGRPGHIDGLCYGANHGDSIVRGFITADVVDQCSGLEAFEPEYTPANTSYPYFADGGGSTGIAIVDNRLWGDIVYVDSANNSAQGSEAVSLWADPAEFTANSTFTFYGRHIGHNGHDARVPLPNRWDQRFFNGGAFSGAADLIVFQQPLHPASNAITCADTPTWWPLNTGVVSLDENAENYTEYPPDVFDLVTQRVPISELAPPYNFGWIHISATYGQLWVQPSLSGHGRFSAGFNGTPVDFLCGLSLPVN